jgi:hypothetical protein
LTDLNIASEGRGGSLARPSPGLQLCQGQTLPMNAGKLGGRPLILVGIVGQAGAGALETREASVMETELRYVRQTN